MKTVLFLIISLFLVSNTSAQLCTPDPAYTQPGIYPDAVTNISNGCAGQFYFQDFTLVVPADTTFAGFTFTVNYMRIDSVTGLPAGVVYICNPSNCTFPGGTSGCINLYGTIPAAGQYNITVYVSGQATHPFFGTQTIPLTYPGYVLNVGNVPVLSTASLEPGCAGNNGAASVTASGSSGYTYTWNTNPPSSNDTIFNLSAGIYSVTVSELYGCTASDTVVLNNTGAPSIDSVIHTNVLCNGGATGSAAVFASGGNPGYSYSWSNGGNTATLSGLAAGTYTVTVNDQSGCQVSTLVNISEPLALTAIISGSNPNCSASADGDAIAFPNGGTSPYDYLWSQGSVSQQVTGLAAGNYTVTITDHHNCTATATTTISTPLPIGITALGTDASCYGSSTGSATAGSTGGTGTMIYTWSNGDSGTNVNGLAAGSYTVTATDANGCTASASVIVGEPAAIMLSENIQQPLCHGGTDGSIGITVTGGSPGYSYQWSNGGATNPLSSVPAGTYTLTVTDNAGCTLSASYTVTDPTQLTLAAVPAPEISGNDGSIAVTTGGGSPPYTYLWSSGQTGEDISAIPAGTYTVTVTDDHGCTLSATATVTSTVGIQPGAATSFMVYPNPTKGIFSIRIHDTPILPVVIELTDAGGKTVYRKTGYGTEHSLDITALPGAIYTVHVIDGKGRRTTCNLVKL